MDQQAERIDDPAELMLARELVSMSSGMVFMVEPMECDDFRIVKITVTTDRGEAITVDNERLAMLLSTLGYNGAVLVYPDDNTCLSCIVWVSTPQFSGRHVFRYLNRANIFGRFQNALGDGRNRFTKIELPLFIKGSEERAIQAISDGWRQAATSDGRRRE